MIDDESPTMCHHCRLIRPARLMRVDPATHDWLHAPHCELPGGLMECDPDQVACGDAAGAVGRVGRGLRVTSVKP